MGQARHATLLTSRPTLVGNGLYAYQPADGEHLELLIAIHRFSGLLGGRHAIAVTYIGDLAGGKQRCNMKMHTGHSAGERFDLHRAQLLRRGIVIGEETAREHLERLTGHQFYYCASCRAVLLPGAPYCLFTEHRKPGQPTEWTGCGAPVAARPARQPITA